MFIVDHSSVAVHCLLQASLRIDGASALRVNSFLGAARQRSPSG
jgi:hypothetical protein